jgi:hypothetical protein
VTSSGYNRARTMRAIFALLALLLSAAAQPSAIEAGLVKRFGVVSVLADRFARSYVGFTAFNNKSEEIDVTSWGMDSAYADQLGKVAAELLRGQYVAAPYSYEDFSKINQFSWRGAPNWPAIEATVKTYCAANELDILLVISKNVGAMPGTTIARVPMGIQGDKSGAFLRLSAAVSIYDCASGHMTETELLRFTPPGHLLWQVPQAEVSRDLISHPLSEMDGKTRDDIKVKLLTLPGPDWDQTLRRMVRIP